MIGHLRTTFGILKCFWDKNMQSFLADFFPIHLRSFIGWQLKSFRFFFLALKSKLYKFKIYGNEFFGLSACNSALHQSCNEIFLSNYITVLFLLLLFYNILFFTIFYTKVYNIVIINGLVSDYQLRWRQCSFMLKIRLSRFG